MPPPEGNPPKPRHLWVERFAERRAYSRDFVGGKVIPRLDRTGHGAALGGQIKKLKDDYEQFKQARSPFPFRYQDGLIVEFQSAPDVELQLKSLESKRQGFELLSAPVITNPQGKQVMLARLFVPAGKLDRLEKLLNDYLNPSKDTPEKQRADGTVKPANPKNRNLLDSIESLRLATVRELWNELEAFPDSKVAILWEAWLRAGKVEGDRDQITKQFRAACAAANIRVTDGEVKMPEQTIVMIKATSDQLVASVELLNCLAELRKPQDFADFFVGQTVAEQAGWVDDLKGRAVSPPNTAPAICVLDTGINRGHPLVADFLPEAANQTVNPGWGSADDQNHGTQMAGICLFGDLVSVIGQSGPVRVPCWLEGVKIVPPEGNDDEKFAAELTQRGVALAEIQNAKRPRTWCLTTSFDGDHNGRPSSWSSELDALAAGVDNEGKQRRLFCVSGGNVLWPEWPQYPDINHTRTVQNPGQSWNTLCVGSFTMKDQIAAANQQCTRIAERGGMSPTNSTSLAWETKWPIKPDVVFEGGNGAKDASGAVVLPELQLLTASGDLAGGSLISCSGTSPATALAARMAAQIQAEYPSYWPETIRALITHSAEWTPAMQNSIDTKLPRKEKFVHLVRRVGFGVPDLERALYCAGQRATMVAQASLQPYRKDKDGDPKLNEMHLYALPWPAAVYRQFSGLTIRLRVTLSYFIEPNPPKVRTVNSNYNYAGCSLRFAISKLGQTRKAFESEINALAEADDSGAEADAGDTLRWRFGERARSKGSLHCDVWEGPAADLIEQRFIGIHPISGWWKTRPFKHRYNEKIRYALLVSLEADSPDIDIYTPLRVAVETPVPIPT
jgi:hypothetical protein